MSLEGKVAVITGSTSGIGLVRGAALLSCQMADVHCRALRRVSHVRAAPSFFMAPVH